MTAVSGIKLYTRLIDEPSPLMRYGLTVLLVALAAFATHYVPVINERTVFLIFFFAILQVALRLGVQAGLIALALSLIVVNCWFLLPGWSSEPYSTFILNTGFCVLAALIIASIHHYQRAATAMRESQHDLNRAQTVAKTGSWRLNVRQNKLCWSDETYRIFGIPKGTPLTYDIFLSTVHPEDREYVDRMWQAALRGEPYDIEHRIVVDGQEKWVHEQADLEFDKNRTLLGGFGTTQDITERKRAEQALRESEERLRLLVDSTPDYAILMIDPEGRVVSWNPGAERITGYQAEEIIGRHFSCFYPKEAVKNGLPAQKLEMARTEGRLEDEGWLVRKDGSRFWANGIITALPDDAGNLKGFSKITRDLTQQKYAEEALAESRQRAKGIIESAMDAIISVDANRRIVLFNAAAEKMLRCAASEAIGSSIDRFIPMRFRDTHAGHIRRFEETGMTSRAMGHLDIISGLRTNGEEFPIEASISQTDAGGQKVFTVILRDITERKQAEEAMKEAGRQKDEFLAMLGHELRNPLMPIRNVAQILCSPSLDEPTLAWACKMLNRNVVHISQIIDDLLDVSRITRGLVTIRRERVELAKLLKDTTESLQTFIQTKHQTLNLELPAQSIYLEGDPVRLTQVFTNLLNNATKYTGEGGRIDLSASIEDMSVVVRVQDNGIGIEPQLLLHIFDLFTQGPQRLDRSEGGLGLGLTLVKKLVELHGGQITASSPGADQGSEFVVQLPRFIEVPVQTEPVNLQRLCGETFQPLRILLIDDNQDIVDTNALWLERMGHQVESASNGTLGISIAQTFAPNIILLDIGLPDMDGYQVARKLREQSSIQSALIIAISGYAPDKSDPRGKASGIDHYLLKPPNLNQLQNLIAEFQHLKQSTLTTYQFKVK